MYVNLINYTYNPERTVAISANLCYSPLETSEVSEKLTQEKQEKLIKKLIKSGHHSPLEHVSFTFGIDGISRACSHQLVRYRLASFSQKSQRYVKENQFDYVIPISFKYAYEHSESLFRVRMKMIQEWYDEAIKAGVPAEDARYYLPNACETNIIVTMNARELLHFFEQRCCKRAQWEIRELANKMLEICKEKAPVIFETAGSQCDNCPEGEFSCKIIKNDRT